MNNNQKCKDDKVIYRSDWQYIFVLLGIGFLTRMIIFSQTYLISIDGAFQYIPVGKLFAWGEYWEAFHQPQMPLFPYLISILTKMIGNFEVSGQIISIITSTLAVIPLFLLGKYIFGKTAAFWAGIFYFLNPEMLQRSADVLKEGLLIFLLFSAVFLFYLFLRRRSISWLVASTLITLLAVLTRAVSLMFIPVFVFWILFFKKRPFDMGLSKRLGYLFVILVLCAVLVVPLMINVKRVTGRWDISKKTVTVQLLIESILFDRTVEIGGVETGPIPLARKIIKVYHPILFLFLLAGLIRRKVINRDFLMEIFLFSFIFGYLIIIGLMMWSTQRYLFFPILLSYLWAGVGIVEIQDLWAKRTHFSGQKVTVVSMLLIFLIFLPVLLNPYRVEKLGVKAIGLWIKSQEIGRPLILTDAYQVAYYAGSDLLLMDGQNYKKYISEARGRGLKYVVVKAKEIEKNYPDLMESVKKNFSRQQVLFPNSIDQGKYVVFKFKE